VNGDEKDALAIPCQVEAEPTVDAGGCYRWPSGLRKSKIFEFICLNRLTPSNSFILYANGQTGTARKS